jgi:hypothetical protein
MDQESARKDVGRAFRVLQARFAIVSGPARMWKKEILRNIMTTCIILHNMTIEFDRKKKEQRNGEETEHGTLGSEDVVSVSNLSSTVLVSPPREMLPNSFAEFLSKYLEIRNREKHLQLRNDLMENLWKIKQKKREILNRLLHSYRY